MKWKLISECPAKPFSADYYLIAHFRQPLDEDGEPDGPIEMVYAHHCYYTSAGWMLNTAGFKGLHGNASFPIHQPTHWMPLPPPPAQAPDQ